MTTIEFILLVFVGLVIAFIILLIKLNPIKKKWEKHKKNKKLHSLELATIFHCDFERIHLFFDGNGRIGRLLLNFILLKNNFPIIIIQNKNKRRYYNSLRRADNGNYLYMVKYLFSELKVLDY